VGHFEQVFEQALRERGWVTGRTSSSPSATRRGGTTGSLPLRPSWSGSGRTLVAQAQGERDREIRQSARGGAPAPLEKDD